MVNNHKQYLYLLVLAAFILPTHAYSQGGIRINPGTQLVLNKTAQLVINNAGITNDGIFAPGNSTVHFTGNTASNNSFIAGNSVTGFYNFLFNKSANGILLNRNISVSNHLTFTQGDSLNLNSFNIDLGTTGLLINETNTCHISGYNGGYIQSTQTLNAPANINPGNLGLEISSSANLGNTIVRRGHVIYGASIARNFQVIPANNSGLNATITFHYLDNELRTLNENLFQIFHSSNAGINWSAIPTNPANNVLNTITASGLSQIKMYTLAEVGAILPVKLLSFNAALVNKQSVLNWASAFELDLDHFEIERSANGINYRTLTAIAGTNNSNTTIKYSYTDIYPLIGLNYYRLKALDSKGQFVYSNVVVIKINTTDNLYLTIYPNPAQSEINIGFSSLQNEYYRIDMLNAVGLRVDSKFINTVTGMNYISWDIKKLPSGIYTLRFTGSSSKSIQFIKH